MHWLEKWLMPPQSVLSGEFAEDIDLTPEEQQALIRLGADICPICAETSPAGKVCTACLQSPPAFNASKIAFDYAVPVSHWIQEFKYQAKRHRGHLLAQLYIREFIDAVEEKNLDLDSNFQGVQAIVAVPMHRNRYRQRGFNQAQILAKLFAKRWQIPLLQNAVERVVNTPPQAELSEKQRLQNLTQAFAVNAQAFEGIQRIALVDDVMTTNATMNALAQTIRQQTSVDFIEAWAIAKTPKPE